MDHPAVRCIRRAEKDTLSRKVLHRLGDLGFGQAPQFHNIPSSIIAGVVDQKQQNMNFTQGKAGAGGESRELAGIVFAELLVKLQQAGVIGRHECLRLF